MMNERRYTPRDKTIAHSVFSYITRIVKYREYTQIVIMWIYV